MNKRQPVPYRVMTDDEIRMAKALGRCSFVPATFDKRFAAQIAARAEYPEATITERQAEILREKVHRYRRQIPLTVVELTKHAAPPVATPAAEQISLSVE